jgi:tRNA modification GTPase
VFDGSEPLTELDHRVSEELRAMGFGTTHNAIHEPTHHNIVPSSGSLEAAFQVSHNHDLVSTTIPSSPGRAMIIVVNKADCPQRLELDELESIWPGVPMVTTSTLTGAGLPELEEALADLVLAGRTLYSESALITSTRHQEALRRVAEHLRASLISLEQALPLDFASIDLRAAYDALGEVTGETASDDLLDRIFSEFCIGK